VLAVRYAIYFSPAKDHPLTEAASRWVLFSICIIILSRKAITSHS